MAESTDESQEKVQEEIYTISLSQSCAYIPKETNVRSGYARDSATFEPLTEETREDSHRRYQAYTNTWTHIKQCMDELLSQQHDALLGDVVQFVERARKRWNDVTEDDNQLAAVILPPYLTMIPTASIILGTSFSDHEVLYQHLVTKLETEVTPHTVTLRSHDCCSGMSAIVKEIHTQLVKGWIPDREKVPQQGNSQQKKLPRLTISTLLSWHLKKESERFSDEEDSEASKHDDASCASNKAKPEVNHRPVVFVLEDFDMFSSQVLEDLIVSLKPHLPSLPLMLILGVATSLSLRSLTQPVLSNLCMEHFRVQPAVTSLNSAVDKILIDSTLRFRLKDKALNYLLHHFLNLNYSIGEFQKGLQFATIEHFCWQPLSFLCDTSCSITKMVNSMHHIQFEMTRSVPSFQRYIESLDDPIKQLNLLKDDIKLQPVIIAFLTDIIEHHKCSPPLLHCLHILTRDLPGAPLGCQIYELYYQSLLESITESVDFESAWKFLRVMTREKLEESVTKCTELLKTYTHPHLSEIAKTFKSFLQELSQVADGGRGHVTSKESKATRKKKQPTDFENIRTKILDYLLGTMRKHLRCIDTFPLYEIFYFNQAPWMKRHLNPVISTVIHKALSKPNYYIPSAGDVSEESGIDPNMPDVCIVYQLYLECGKLINVKDWRKAFVSVVAPDVEDNDDEDDDDDNVLHERFHSAVSQLQFMGFVQPAKRKKDHMQRLTWYH